MDIYTRFNLPPPPAPNLFSHAASPTRARFANFQTVPELEHFLWQVACHPRALSSYRLMPFEAAYVMLLELYLGAFILSKIKDGSWWLVRLSVREHGTVIIPNAHNAWSLSLGAFGLVFVYVAIITRICHDRGEALPQRGLTFSMMWIPLVFASTYQGWALIYADVDSHRPLKTAQATSGWRKRLQPPAWLINTTFIATPFLALASVSYHGAHSDQLWKEGRHLWLRWIDKYQSQDTLTREMLLEAQAIWNLFIEASYYFTFALIILLAWLLVVGTFHIMTAWHLILKLLLHMRRMRALQRRPSRPMLSTSTPSTAVTSSAPSTLYGKVTSTFMRWKKTPVRDQSIRANLVVEEADQVRSRLVTEQEEARERPPGFFPPIRPSKMVTKMPRSQAEKVLFYFALQAVTITLGGLTFLGQILWSIFYTVPTMEAGDPGIVDFVDWNITVSVVMVLGTATAISNLHTFFEASFAALVSGFHLRTTQVTQMTGIVFGVGGERNLTQDHAQDVEPAPYSDAAKSPPYLDPAMSTQGAWANKLRDELDDIGQFSTIGEQEHDEEDKVEYT